MKQPRNRTLLKYISLGCMMIGLGLIFVIFHGHTHAEQSGTSPESNATSRLKSLESDLVTLGFGSATDSPDWGSAWNRIKTAAKYTPSGTATVSDVVSGKTFSDSTRSTKTGTYPAPVNGCSSQIVTSGTGTDTLSCSLTWTTATNPVTGDDNLTGRGGKDPRVPNLIWSQALYKNGTVVQFSPTQNTAFSWDNSTAANQGITAPVAGSRTAAQLCSDQGNGWRLPTEFELMQAAIDGSYFNLTQAAVAYWSSTELTTNAWIVGLDNGQTRFFAKNVTFISLRCVRSGN